MAVIFCLQLFASPASAQQPKAAEHFENALEARERGDYDQALQHLERAQLAEPRPQFIYHRIVVLEAMGEPQLALDVLAENRRDLAGAQGVDDLAVLEQRLQDQAHEESQATTNGDTDVLGWSLVGGGAAFLGGGVVSFLVAESEADRLRCSPHSSADKTGCDGVEAHDQLSQAEFASKRGDVTLYRVAGAGLSAIGAASLGWGLYRLLGSERRSQASVRETGPTMRATVTAGGRVGIEVKYRF